MKKIILTFLAILWISTIACAAPAEKDPEGFNGYPWDTSFDEVHNEVHLVKKSSKNGFSIYSSVKGSIIDLDNDSGIVIFYCFYDHQLVGGMWVTYNQQEQFCSVAKNLREYYGTPPDQLDSKSNYYYYKFPTSLVFYAPTYENDPSLSAIISLKRNFYEKNKDKF